MYYTRCMYIGINNIRIYNIILILIYSDSLFPISFVPGGLKNRNRYTTCTVQLLYQCCSPRYIIICHIVGHPHNPRTRVYRFTTTIIHTYTCIRLSREDIIYFFASAVHLEASHRASVV